MTAGFGDVAIIAVGARTPVGLTADASAAAVRGAISVIAKHPHFVDKAGEPMRMTRDSILPVTLDATDRCVELAKSAFLEATQPLRDHHIPIRSIPAVIGLPEKRPGRSSDLEAALGTALMATASDCGWSLQVQTIAAGHSAGLMALDVAARRIEAGEIELCLAGGVDSYIQGETCSIGVAMVFGGSLAFLVERTNMPLRNATYAFMLIPLALPTMLKAIGWTLLLNPRTGLINQGWFNVCSCRDPLFNANSLPAMFWVEGLSMAPLTFLMLGAALRMMDPALEEAAYTSGAGAMRTAYRVTLRLMWPALAGIVLLLFVRGIEAFEVPLIMGAGKGILVFSTTIYLSIRELYPPLYGVGFALSLTLVAMALLGVLLYQRTMGHHERFATITGKGFRPRLINLGKWRWAAGGLAVFFMFVAVIAPMLALVWASLLRVYQVPSEKAFQSLTLENYEKLFNSADFMLALGNTVILAVGCALGCMLLALLVSWVMIRRRASGAKILDILIFSSFAVPAIAFGFSFMVVFLAFPNPIYGTIWIILLAYMASFLPVATRFTHAAVAQLSKELEEAATMAGAPFFSVLWRVTVPLILPSLVGGALFIFLLAAKVPTIAMLLFTPESLVLSVWVWRFWTDGEFGLTSALSVIIMLALTTIVIAGRSWIQRGNAIEKV